MSRAVVAILALAALAAPAAAAPKGWWDRKWGHRKRIVLAERQRWADAEGAHIRIATGGRSKPDGSDIRVIADGSREVPRGIVARGPGDLFEVAFPVGRESEWEVYYGNPEAAEPDEPYVPKRGLILETRARGAGDPRNWAEMEKILAGSTRVYGGSYWPRIFDAENPFGPSDDFVSIYRGHLLVPKDGAYTFFTASDEASFLLVDEKLIAQWPGWHDARRGRWGTYKGRINLKAGLHTFQYFHVERRGGQVMAAYWQPPGAKKGRVIPDSAFPGLRLAQVVSHEGRGTDFAADFTAAPAAKWGMDNRVFTDMVMKALLAGPRAEYRWDFGDGTKGEGPIVHHVYLRGGDYDVALTVVTGEGRDDMIRTIHVPDQWTRYDRNRPEVLAQFARIVSTYSGARLSAKSLQQLIFLLEQAGEEDALAVLLKDAVDRGRLLRDRERFETAMRLGEHHRNRSRDLKEAMWAFRKASATEDGGLRIRAHVALADALLELGGDVGTARLILLKALETVGGRQDDTARLAWMRTGDACMILGERKQARAYYERALELAGGLENSKRILRKAAAMRSTLTFLGEGEKIRVMEYLREWEWQEPTDRFHGLHRIAKARTLMLREESDLATRELKALLAGNPESEYADQALSLLADIARAAGRSAEADAYLERLGKEYPWSPLAK